MKENTNIEDLFKDKFDNFEANVDPSVWANVSQSINAGATSAGTAGAGLSGIAKVAIIAAAVTVTSVSVWYFTKDSDEEQISEQEQIITSDQENNESALVSITEENIQVGDTNDPVIQENMQEIQEEFSAVEISTENFDEELIDILLENQNRNNATPVVTQEDNTSTETSNNDNSEETSNSDNQEQVEDKPEIVEKKVKVNLDYQMQNNELTFSSGAKNHFQTEWTFGDGTTSSKDNGAHTYEKPGKYDVMLKVMGESGTTVYEFTVEVEGTSKIAEIPNVITPNNDGANDYFFIETEDIEEFTIVIYDLKTGQEIFRSENPDFNWNGEQPDGSIVKGSYLYKVVAVGNDGAVHKKGGRITVQ